MKVHTWVPQTAHFPRAMERPFFAMATITHFISWVSSHLQHLPRYFFSGSASIYLYSDGARLKKTLRKKV